MSSKIIWDCDVDAPGCPGQILNAEDESQTRLVQTDWDFPGVAMTFGWSPRDVQRTDQDGEPLLSEPCDHGGTDGTVDCEACGVTAGEFIEAARKWLEDHDGAIADDPGYFE